VDFVQKLLNELILKINRQMLLLQPIGIQI